MPTSFNDLRQKPWFIPAAIATAAVLVLGFVLFLVNNNVKNAGNKKEAALNAQYSNNANYLSDCIVRIRESSSVLKGQTGALDQILTDAVKGRYDGNGSSADVGRGQLFSAIVEAYPNLEGLNAGFNNVLSVVNGCRTDYRGMQTKLLDEIRVYDAWRTGSWTVRTFGGEFPSGNLEAKKGNEILSGKAALAQMKTIVVVSDANKAYETGELTAEDPFGTNKP